MVDADSETVRMEAANVAMKKEDVASRRVRIVGFVIVRHILFFLLLYVEFFRWSKVPAAAQGKCCCGGSSFFYDVRPARVGRKRNAGRVCSDNDVV